MARWTQYMHISNLLMICGLVLFATAVFSLHWLQNDNQKEQLHHLGLFKVCWKNLSDAAIPRHLICSPMYHKRVYDDGPHLTSAFLKTCQVCFGFSWFTVAAVGVAHLLYFTSRHEKNSNFSEGIIKAIIITSGMTVVLTTIGLICFDIFKNNRNWIPRSDHNYFSWSFYVAILSSVFYLLVMATASFELKWLKQKTEEIEYVRYEMVNVEDDGHIWSETF